ncbi:hypothetical protein BN844_4143 [Pseudomonas sp. SHC52]|nr:hypothetical protein BN844_4143 [Pseudomonas sp. SHC52]
MGSSAQGAEGNKEFERSHGLGLLLELCGFYRLEETFQQA